LQVPPLAARHHECRCDLGPGGFPRLLHGRWAHAHVLCAHPFYASGHVLRCRGGEPSAEQRRAFLGASFRRFGSSDDDGALGGR
ncbi:unnamed protein product, partial [Symbiodinium sp. CCMP2456]